MIQRERQGYIISNTKHMLISHRKAYYFIKLLRNTYKCTHTNAHMQAHIQAHTPMCMVSGVTLHGETMIPPDYLPRKFSYQFARVYLEVVLKGGSKPARSPLDLEIMSAL